jgi:hypothetical protein
VFAGSVSVSARSRLQSGHALLESVLIMPLMIFFVLGLVQLTAIQHAKVLTEYAAFNAARAGIVWNGNHQRMQDAAAWSLLPTAGRTDSWSAAAESWARFQIKDRVFRELPWNTPVPGTLNGSPLRGLIRVDTLNPSGLLEYDNIWNLRGGRNWQELDFDGPSTYPESPLLARFFPRFYERRLAEPDQDRYRNASTLTIRVRYWYELKIPFANWLVFLCWYAANAGVPLRGGVERPTLGSTGMLNREADVEALAPLGQGISHPSGYHTVYRSEMTALWLLATGRLMLPDGERRHRFFLPLNATYSMRMQSNFHRKWLMHPQEGR